jgi:hypothetical protein
LAQIFSSAPCSQTPSVYVPPYFRDQLLHTYRTTSNISLVYSNFYIFWQQTRRQKVLDWMVANITEFGLLLLSSWIIFWFVIVIPNIWTVTHFKMICLLFLCPDFDCILEMKHWHTHSFLCLLLGQPPFQHQSKFICFYL